jgi:hypothetical protein
MDTKQDAPKKTKAAPKKAKSMDVALARRSMGKPKNINFDHIMDDPTNMHKAYCLAANQPAGNIHMHQQRGWQLVETSDLNSHFIDPDSESNSVKKDSYASVVVGAGADGPLKNYLMWMPIKQYEDTILKWKDEEARNQLESVDQKVDDSNHGDHGVAGVSVGINKAGSSLEFVDQES